MAGGFGRVLVTGGTGFLGCHLVEQLVADNHTVRVLEKPGVVTSHLPIDKIEIVFGDLRDERAVKEAAVGCDLVCTWPQTPTSGLATPTNSKRSITRAHAAC